MRYDLRLPEKKVTEIEEEIRGQWEKQDVFQRSVKQRPENKTWTFYDGPPFATGLPHYGHILAGALKDMPPRYFTMLGYRVERRWGWDCHGVPIEYEVEKEHGLKGVQGIEQKGIAKFNEICRSVVLRRRQEWRASQRLLGRFVDMDNDYKTMDRDYMESVWKVFCKIHEKGLVYEGKRVIAYSPGLGTPLSDFEARLGYKEVMDPAIMVEFPLVDDQKISLIIWTTTPWSLVTNAAIAINPEILYVKVTTNEDKHYIVAKRLVAKLFDQNKIKQQEDIKSDQLIGKKYTPIFSSLPKTDSPQCFSVIASDHVTDGDGTGLVHISPAHGDDDYKLGLTHNLPSFDFVDRECVFTGGIPEVKGKFFKEADAIIIQLIKDNHRLFKQEEYKHEYPFCWRTEKPLMYRAMPSWYIKVTEIKDKLVANNKQIKWHPEHVGSGRFGHWISNARDWSVSRDRYWGCPVPIWRNVADPNDVLFISSVAELEKLTGKKISDLHRPFIDELMIEKDNKRYKRIPQVFDCWFESGAMPYAQEHYMFDKDDDFLTRFPADYIAEGIDQTRGWFYTLNVIATILYDKPAFKNCVVNGILLGTDGKKMSKRDKNYPDINLVFKNYGADSLRLFLLGSSATAAQDLAVDEKKMEEITKQVQLPLLNIYKFFVTYAKNANYHHTDVDLSQLKDPMDMWLVVRVEKFKEAVKSNFDNFNSIGVSQNILKFIGDLTNWYVHNHRKAFSSAGKNKQSFDCLYFALNTFSLCAAPIIPFITDAIFKGLNGSELSVHLQDWPKPISMAPYEAVFNQIEKIREIVELGMQVRESNKVRLRQPVSAIYLNKNDFAKLAAHEAFIKNTLNAKSIKWIDESEFSDMLKTVIKLDPKVVGKKYKGLFKQMISDIAQGKYEFQNNRLTVADQILQPEDYTVQLIPKDNNGSARNNRGVWILIDFTMTDELKREGTVRDFMRELQDCRKRANFTVDQDVIVSVSPELLAILNGYEELIKQETGCTLTTNPLGQETKYTSSVEIKLNVSINMALANKKSEDRVSNNNSTPFQIWKPGSSRSKKDKGCPKSGYVFREYTPI